MHCFSFPIACVFILPSVPGLGLALGTENQVLGTGCSHFAVEGFTIQEIQGRKSINDVVEGPQVFPTTLPHLSLGLWVLQGPLV